MTDTPTIALYYKEHDPMKRKMFLDQSIAAGEDEEANAVRKEIWEIRYGGPSELGPDTRADGYLIQKSKLSFLSFDLHVLGMPPAFILSQDQTLHLI